MKFWLIILLPGLCLPHWTTADEEVTLPPIVKSSKKIELVLNISTHLNLSHRGIQDFDDSYFNSSAVIESLDLSHNELEGIDPWTFENLPNLQRLSLANNRISSFDYAFSQSPKLTYVDISSNGFDTLTKDLVIGLQGQAIIYVGKQNYEIYDPKWARMDVEIRERFRFTETNSQLGLNSLTSSKLYNNNGITDITPGLLNNLAAVFVNIDLSSNKITIIKNNIIENRYIKEIMLNDNLIGTIEDGAFNNTGLNTLYLRKNRLNNLTFVKTLPATMIELYLSQNSIREIPAGTFQGLENLKKLELGDSGVEIIQPGAFRGLKMLTRLDLSFNKIKTIAQGVISKNDIPKVNVIDFYHNQIDTIETRSFSDLNVMKINLADNKITEESFALNAFERCTISILMLNDNLISEINHRFPDTSRVEELYLERNNISRIRRNAIRNSPDLRTFRIDENPLNHLQRGALFGLTGGIHIDLIFVPIEYIEGGVFEDYW